MPIKSAVVDSFRGLPSQAYAVASNVGRRAYGEVEYSQATGTHIKVGIAPDTSAGK